MQLIPRNPCDLVDPPRVQQVEMKALDEKQLIALLAAIRHSRLHVPALLAATTGMRRGELLGLKWPDVNSDTGEMQIIRSLQETPDGLSFKTPKTRKGRRTILLPKLAISVLKTHRVQQNEERLMMHRGLDMTVTQILRTGDSRLRRTDSYLCTIMAGAEPTSLPVEIQSQATYATSYSFSLPDGEKLIAVWDDGVAVDYDPGIPSTVRIPGLAGWKATAVDVLNGYEQELVSTSEDGNAVVRDLLPKDYPIIIRLSK